MGEHKLPKEEHLPGRLPPAIDADKWQQPKVVQDGEGTKGLVQLASGLETNPCFTCRSFEKDETRLRQHCEANGLVPDKDGVYTTPIVKSIAGRKSLRLDPRDCGWCRRQGCVVHMGATCEEFVATATRAEMTGKIKAR